MLRCVVRTLLAGAVAVGAPLPAQADEDPLTISVSTVGRFAKGHSWHLSVNSAGQAELTVNTVESPEPIRKQFQVPKEQWAAFRKALADGRFFELKGEYGDSVPDGSERSITVTAGRHAHTVKIHYLRTSTAAGRAAVREASGAVRLLALVRGWFDEAAAVDLRRYDQAALDGAKD
jgi:hypothetical protein